MSIDQKLDVQIILEMYAVNEHDTAHVGIHGGPRGGRMDGRTYLCTDG